MRWTTIATCEWYRCALGHVRSPIEHTGPSRSAGLARRAQIRRARERTLPVSAREALVEKPEELGPSVASCVLAAHEVVRRDLSRPVAFRPVIGEEPHGDGLEIGWNALPVLARAPDGLERGRRFGIARQPRATPLEPEELPEHAPDRVQIGPRIELLATRLLGRHVAGRAHDRVRAHGHGPFEHLGHAEVGELNLALPREQRVAGVT